LNNAVQANMDVPVNTTGGGVPGTGATIYNADGTSVALKTPGTKNPQWADVLADARALATGMSHMTGRPDAAARSADMTAFLDRVEKFMTTDGPGLVPDPSRIPSYENGVVGAGTSEIFEVGGVQARLRSPGNAQATDSDLFGDIFAVVGTFQQSLSNAMLYETTKAAQNGGQIDAAAMDRFKNAGALAESFTERANGALADRQLMTAEQKWGLLAEAMQMAQQNAPAANDMFGGFGNYPVANTATFDIMPGTGGGKYPTPVQQFGPVAEGVPPDTAALLETVNRLTSNLPVGGPAPPSTGGLPGFNTAQPMPVPAGATLLAGATVRVVLKTTGQTNSTDADYLGDMAALRGGLEQVINNELLQEVTKAATSGGQMDSQKMQMIEMKAATYQQMGSAIKSIESVMPKLTAAEKSSLLKLFVEASGNGGLLDGNAVASIVAAGSAR
jgi:hypothetical protein